MQWDSEPSPVLPLAGVHETIRLLDMGQGRGTREALFSIALHHHVSQSVTRSCTQNLSSVLFLPGVIVFLPEVTEESQGRSWWTPTVEH